MHAFNALSTSSNIANAYPFDAPVFLSIMIEQDNKYPYDSRRLINSISSPSYGIFFIITCLEYGFSFAC